MGAYQALSRAEKQILVRILKAKLKEITEGRLKDELAIQKLTRMKLITFVPKKGRQRVGRYKLTALGEDIAQKASEELGRKPAQKVKPTTRLTVTLLKQEMDFKLDEILHRVGRIEKRLGIIGSEFGSKATIGEEDLPNVLKEVYEEICSTEPRFSNLIPLSSLKTKLYEKYNLSNELVDQTLLRLEKERKLDLQVAYDAGSLTGAEYGIKIPGRGLVFYVRWRK